ncbi:GntR family transcriptional regulator [Brucella pituitosa]|uniref:GntR family transcriptional regulator n=1 Tax=Brucella pituitosa TaxID=571256 RepID=UPI000D00CA8B|nr:transcriptional regulator [Ochrobactrum sp. MYb68]
MKPQGKIQSQIVYDRIRSDVIRAVIYPGARVKISDYVELLDVRLGAVREALSKLTSDGWVISEPQRGFRAAPVTSKELLDLTRSRVEIETFCIRSAIVEGNIQWEANILACLHALERTPEFKRDDNSTLSEEWASAHARFHHALVCGCDNAVMLEIRAQLYERTERYRRLSAPLKPSRGNGLSEHRQLAKAIIARDTLVAEQRMREHLNQTAEILLESFSSLAAETYRSPVKLSEGVFNQI